MPRPLPDPTVTDRHLADTRSTPHTTVRRWVGATDEIFEKVHRDPARLEREHAALTGWAATLGQSPRVLRRSTDTLWLAGVQGEGPPLPLAAWSAAGRWLARAHALPCPAPDPVPVPDALRRRWRGLCRRARRVLDPELVARCARIVGEPERLAQPRVWCHRDFTPDNWVWDGAAERLWILDFEHARPDVPWSDTVKLEATAFVQKPAARDAFHAGYGVLPAPGLRRARVAWHGLATLTWGLRGDDRPFIALGHQVLSDLGLPGLPPLSALGVVQPTLEGR